MARADPVGLTGRIVQRRRRRERPTALKVRGAFTVVMLARASCFAKTIGTMA